MITLIVSYRFPWKRFNWYAVISFTILLGIKGNGIDYGIYNYAFSLLVNNPNSLFSSNYLAMLQDNMVGVDFGYLHLAVIKLISFISSSSVWYFSFLALLQILGLDLFIQQFRKKSIKCLLVFFFFTTLMFSETFIAMRQMSAFLLYLPLIKFIINKDLKKYVIGCVLLATIHKSILIMLPVYFLVDKNYLKNIKLQIILYLFVIILASFLEKKSEDFLWRCSLMLRILIMQATLMMQKLLNLLLVEVHLFIFLDFQYLYFWFQIIKIL